MSRIELHIHTTASDGTFTPGEIIRKAADRGMEYVAVTDHDTVGGVAEAMTAAAKFPGLTCLPGLEINTDVENGEAHVLGYFLDYYDPGLNAHLERLRVSRVGRAQRMIEKLAALDIDIAWERVKELAGSGSIGRPHIALALLEKGYIKTFNEAFDRYIGHGGSAYVERAKISPAEAVAIIAAARGVAVLAHPFTVGDPAAMVKELVPAGLCGLEVYYGDYNTGQVATLRGLCREHGLIATGGSDYHGIASRREPEIGDVNVPPSVIKGLFNLARERGLEIITPR